MFSQTDNFVPQVVLCSVNVQHNCAAHGCDDSAHVARFAEREHIGVRAAVSHREKGDLLLNTFQMRSACFIQRLRLEREPLDRDKAIHEGAQAEIDARKASEASAQRRPSHAQAAVSSRLAQLSMSTPS